MPEDFLFDNMRQYLRRRAPFGGLPEDSVSQEHAIVPFIKGGRIQDVDDEDEDSSLSIRRRMSELYTPEHTASDAYMKHISEMPVRNKPGLLRKIAAGVAAFGSRPDDAERVMYSPYRRNLQDWSVKLEPLQRGADLERQNNSQERMMANQIISSEMSDRRLQRQIRRDATLREQGERRIAQGDARVAQGDARLAQAEERMKIARELSKGGQFDVDDAGNARIIRKDGSIIPVDGQYLSFEEKEQLRAETAAARAKAVAENSRPRVIERTIEYPEGSGKLVRARINLDTGEATPITIEGQGTAQPPKPALEETRDVNNKAKQVQQKYPQWSKYIEFDTAGRFKRIKPTGRFTGPSKEDYDKIYEAIYGESKDAPAKPSARATGPGPGPRQNTQAPNAKPVRPGYVRVRGPQGQTGQDPVGEAIRLPPGWRVEGR